MPSLFAPTRAGLPRPHHASSALTAGALVALLLVGACGSEPTRQIPNFGSDAALDTIAPTDTTDDAEETAPDAPAAPDLGPGDDAEDDTDEPIVDIFPRVVAGVDTRLSATSVRAGTSVYVDCVPINDAGEPLLLDPAPQTRITTVPSEAFQRRGGNEYTAVRVGEAAVTCALPEYGVIDRTPARLRILPGPPATAITLVDEPVVAAGETVRARCEVFDEFGNAIPVDDASLRTDPFGAGVNVNGLRATFQRAGLYQLTCDVTGAATVVPTLVEVQPGAPFSMALGLQPDLPRYGLNSVVTLRPVVQDRWGNRIPDAPFRIESTPPLPEFGPARFRLVDEGTFTLAAVIDPPNASGGTIRATRSIVVSGAGPAIECDAPLNNAMIDLPPSGQLTFRGSASDEFGIESVTINGVPATVEGDGSFAAVMPVRFGVNFAEVIATDDLGETSRRICTFLASAQWAAPDAFLDGDVVLRLAQDAIDDGDPRDFDSINDFLVTALNSRGLRDTIDAALQDANPIYPRTCVADTFLGCLTYLSVTYEDLRLDGPHTTTLQLLDGGMRVIATVRGIGVRLRIGGTFSTSGWVTVRSLAVDISFNAALAGGRPVVTLRGINDVQVGGVDSNFSGLVGWIVNLVVDIFEGRIRNLIRDTVRDFIRDSFNDVLDGLFGGLEIDTLGDTINVPRLDSAETIPLAFAVRIDDLNFSPARALFSLSSSITGPVLRGVESRGVAVPGTTVRLDPTTPRSVVAAIQLGLLNQALHAAWQGGLFDATIGGDTLGDGIPAEAAGSLRMELPLVAGGTDDGALRAMLGGATVGLVYPGIFDTPVPIELGASVSVRVTVIDDATIEFESVSLDEFYFDTGAVVLDARSEQLVEQFLRSLIQRVVDDSLAGALPALPIPSFEIPTSLSVYDLPGGRDLRLLSPLLEILPTHFIAAGNFGVR